MSRFCPLPENVLGCQDGAVLGGLVCKGWACCSTSYDVQTVLQNKELLSPRHKWRWGSATARAQVSTRRTLVTFCHSARQVCCAAVTDASEVPGHKCEWTSRGERSTGPGQQELSLLILMIPWGLSDPKFLSTVHGTFLFCLRNDIQQEHKSNKKKEITPPS